jgi:hypothetical protein
MHVLDVYICIHLPSTHTYTCRLHMHILAVYTCVYLPSTHTCTCRLHMHILAVYTYMYLPSTHTYTCRLHMHILAVYTCIYLTSVDVHTPPHDTCFLQTISNNINMLHTIDIYVQFKQKITGYLATPVCQHDHICIYIYIYI